MKTLLAGLALCATAATAQAGPFYFGADLSYVNEMEDCGAQYREGGVVREPYALFREHGANLVRIRLWNDADWTQYSNLADVRKSIARAKAQGMQVLLDFHYSDDWADGEKQIPPKAWARIKDAAALAQTLYQYTYDTLRALDKEGLMPELVQVGNETNPELLGGVKGKPIDWARNARLFNAGIHAVHDAGAQSKIHPRVMLHIAQPENAEPWFADATKAGVSGFDLIGLSYYPKWSTRSIKELGRVINHLHQHYAADVMVVETAYPWTLDNADPSPNLLGSDSLLSAFRPTPQGQQDYLIALTQAVIDNGGVGVVYWEPAWVSTRCSTRWGRGSNWDNATFFDFKDELLPGIDFMQYHYKFPGGRQQ